MFFILTEQLCGYDEDKGLLAGHKWDTELNTYLMGRILLLQPYVQFSVLRKQSELILISL